MAKRDTAIHTPGRLLVQFLVERFAVRLGKVFDGVTAQTMRRLTEYAWPGNVRELENVLERACILATSPIIELGPDVLPTTISLETATATASRSASLEQVAREHLLTVLREHKWIIDGPNGAAKVLDLHPNTLRSRLKRLGITRPATADLTASSHDRS